MIIILYLHDSVKNVVHVFNHRAVAVRRFRQMPVVRRILAAHKNRSADLDLRHVAKPVALEGIRLICRCNYSGIFRFSLTGYVFPLFPVKLTRNPFSILNL